MRKAMTKTFMYILLLCLISIGSCDIFEDDLWQTIAEAYHRGQRKGHVTNCDPSESSFAMDWFPDPMVKGESVTVEGNYTFPEDFEEGVVHFHVKVGPIPVEKSFKFRCSMISDKPCKQGNTVVGSRIMRVPRDLPIPAGRRFKVEAKLINRMTGNEIGCAEAEVEVEDRIK